MQQILSSSWRGCHARVQHASSHLSQYSDGPGQINARWKAGGRTRAARRKQHTRCQRWRMRMPQDTIEHQHARVHNANEDLRRPARFETRNASTMILVAMIRAARASQSPSPCVRACMPRVCPTRRQRAMAEVSFPCRHFQIDSTPVMTELAGRAAMHPSRSSWERRRAPSVVKNGHMASYAIRRSAIVPAVRENRDFVSDEVFLPAPR